MTNLDLGNHTVYNIGAAHGIFTIFFARAVGKKGHVFASEPSPELSMRTIESVQLNQFNNVKMQQIAMHA